MQSFLIYLLQAAGCVSIAWLFYKVLLEKKTRAKTIRLYFIMAMVVSLLAPLSPWAIRTSFFAANASAVTNNTTHLANGDDAKGTIPGNREVVRANTTPGERWNVVTVFFYGYLAIATFFVLRLGWELYALASCYRKATKEKWNNLQIVWNDR